MRPIDRTRQGLRDTRNDRLGRPGDWLAPYVSIRDPLLRCSLSPTDAARQPVHGDYLAFDDMADVLPGPPEYADLQRDALLAAGIDSDFLYEDKASGKKDDRPQLAACLKALRHGDTLVVWKLDRLGRDLRHLVNIVHELTERGIGLKVLTGQGAAIDTTTSSGKLVFGIFAALAEFERELISERTIAGLASARARGRKGGRPYKMTPAKLRLALASMGKSGTKVSDLCTELGITRQTLYRHVSPTGELRPDGEKLLSR
ncbi:UNVERIFIED_ORG: DNA invertase Pin-like site-specific DNA recombinase [Arthrobacter sp. UYCu721]